MALEGLGTLKDIVVRIRGQGAALKQSLAEAQNGVNRVRVSMGGVNAAGLGAVRIYRTLGVTLAGLAAIVGVSTLIRNLQRMVSEGAAFNAQLEQMTLGIKSVVAANVEVVSSTGQQIEGAEKLRLVGREVADQIERMKTDAILTTATLQQIVEAFQGAVPPAAAVGLKLDDVRKVTIAIVQAAGAIGLPLQQVAVEVREILGGTIHTRTRLAQSLAITNDMVRSWKEQGTLVQELLGRMSAFTLAGQEAGETFTGILSTLRDFREQLLGAAVGPAQERLRQLLIGLRDSLGEVRAGVFLFNEGLREGFATAGAILKGVVDVAVELGAALRRLVRFALDLTPLDEILGLIVRKVGSLVTAVTAWSARMRGAITPLDDLLQPMQDLQAAADAQEKTLRREAEALESAAAALADSSLGREQQRETIAALARDYPEFVEFLVDENKATADAVPLIQARVTALQAQAREQRELQVQALRDQEGALQRELEIQRQRVAQGIAPAEAATQRLVDLERQLREVAGRRRTAEIEVTLQARPRPETEEQRKAREKVELERRKTALAELLQVQQDALVDLELAQAEFDLRQDASGEERIRREEEFLRRKQEIERTKLSITIEGLRTEARLVEEKVGKEKEAEVQLLALRRDIAGKEADLANLVKRQRIEALQAVRDKEKQLEAERENAALGFLGRLTDRLKRGPLAVTLPGGPGRLFQTEQITEETPLTPELVAAARRAMGEEQAREIAQLQAGAGRGLLPEQFARLIEARRAQREEGETLTKLGGFEESLGAATGLPGAAFVAQQLQGFDAIEGKARETFPKVREIFKETYDEMIADSLSFQGTLVSNLFDQFYRKLVDKLGNEFKRQ